MPYHRKDLALKIAVRGTPLALVDTERSKAVIAGVYWFKVSVLSFSIPFNVSYYICLLS